jgi:hypothetical protein
MNIASAKAAKIRNMILISLNVSKVSLTGGFGATDEPTRVNPAGIAMSRIARTPHSKMAVLLKPASR